MATVFWIIVGIAWLGCGAYAVSLDLKHYPKTVVAGADEMLRAVLFCSGPVGLLAISLIHS